MSKYGLKIKNIEAGSLYGYNLGVRDAYDSTNAMLTNSLFSDFIKSHGLNVWKEESTRDIICIEFNYGSRSYDEEIKHLNKSIKKTEKDESLTEDKKQEKIDFFNELRKKADENKDLNELDEEIRDI